MGAPIQRGSSGNGAGAPSGSGGGDVRSDGTQPGVKPGTWLGGPGTSQDDPEAYGAAWDEERAQERFSYGNAQQNPLLQGQVDQVRSIGDQGKADLVNIGQNAQSFARTAGTHIADVATGEGNRIADQGQTLGTGVADYATRAGNNISSYGTNTANQLQSYGTDQAKALQGVSRGISSYGSDLAGDAAGYQGRAGAQADLGQAGTTQQGALSTAGQLTGIEQAEGPSAAQAQLQSGLNRAQASSLAMARSGRGYGQSASALTQAASQNAAMSQEAVNSSAALRAQENAAFRTRAASNLVAAGGLQAGVGSQQAQQQLAQAQLQQSQHALNDQAQLTQQGQALAAQQAGAQGQLSAAQLGAQSIQQAGALGVGAQQAGAQVAGQGQVAGAGIQQQGAVQGAQVTQQGLQAGAGVQQQGYGQQMAGAEAGLNAQLSGEQMAQNIYGAQLDAGIQRQAQQVQEYGIQQGVAVQQSAQNAAVAGAVLGAGGAIVGGVIGGPPGAIAGGAAGSAAGQAASDQRAKKNVREEDGDLFADLMSPSGKKDAMDMGDELDAVSYDYKDPARHGSGRRLGVMAQDLERTKAGRAAVSEAPDGTKMVDIPRLAMSTAAGFAGMSDRLAAIEAQLDRIAGKKGKAAVAYGNVVAYQPIEGAPDAYRFQMADGSSMPVMGQAAADLKSRVDAADALTASGRLASNANMSVDPSAGGAPVATDAAPGGMSGADDGPAAAAPAAPPPAAAGPPPGPNMSVAPPPGPAEPSMSPNTGGNPVLAPSAPPVPKPLSPTAGATVAPVGGANVGVIKGADGQLYQYHAPSAGSPGGLALRTQSQSGGFSPSDQYVEQQNEAYMKRQAAAEVGMQAAQEQAAGQQAFLAEQARQQNIEQQEAARRQDQIAVGVESLQAKYDQALKEYSSSAPPEDRRSGAQRVIGALAMGMGAFGAAMTHSPNFAMEIISKSINDDIRSQEAAIAIRKDKANNALGDLQRQMGSLELARSATRGIRLQQAKTQYDRIAATTADAQVRAGALEMSARLEKEHSDTLEDYRLESLGQVTKSFVNTPKVAASAGGYRPLTKQAIDFQKDAASLDSSAAGTAKTLSTIGKGGVAGPAGAKASSELSGLNAALAGLDQFEAMHAKYGSPGVINSGVGGSEASQKLGSAANALGPIIGRGLEGNAPNDSTMKDIKGNLLSASGGKIKSSIAEYRQQLENRRKAIQETMASGLPAPEEPRARGAPVTLVQDQLAKVSPLGPGATTLATVRAEQAEAAAAAQAGGGETLAQESARLRSETEASYAEQSRLEGEHSRLSTVATQGARGFMDALLGSGALVGAGAEGLGTLAHVDTLRDFGRDLGRSASGESAAEAMAFLFKGGGEEGLSNAERVQRDIDEQERAHPMLASVSRTAGQAALALAGGEVSAASKGGALLGTMALEGAGAGAQGAYENSAPLRDVLTSTLLGAGMGYAGGAGAEYVGGALARRAATRAATAEEGALLSRVFGSVDRLSEATAQTAERAGGREAQGVLRELERARDEVVSAAKAASGNPTLAAEAGERATAKVSRDLAEKAGPYDAARVLEQAPTPLQKVVYRKPILDEASSRLSEAVSSASRPGLDFELSDKALRTLTKGAEPADAIGGLQASLRSAIEQAPATAGGDQAGRLLRQSSAVLDRAEVPAAMQRGHGLARDLLAVAESAPDQATKDYASRTARAVMDEMSGDQWGKAGAYYRELTAPPSDAFAKMADPQVLRAALASAEYRGAIGSAVSAEAKAVALAHDARIRLSGTPLAREERKAVAAGLSSLEDKFSRAEEAVTVDGGPAGKVLDWFKDRVEDKVLGAIGGSLGGAVGGIPGAALGYVVSNAVRPAVKKLLPALVGGAARGLEAAAGPVASALGRAGPALARATADELSPDEQQDRYRRRVDAAFSVQSAPDLPGVAAGTARVGLPPGALGVVAADYRQKMQNFLQDVPKPRPSLKGKAWETMSDEQLRLSNAMWEATVDPLSVFSDFASGDVDYDKAQYAWRQYPGLQVAAQAAFSDQLTGMTDEERTDLPDDVLGQVDFLLGYGGTLEPSLDRGFSSRMDQAGEQARQGGQPRGPSGGGVLDTAAAEPTFAARLARGPRS